MSNNLVGNKAMGIISELKTRLEQVRVIESKPIFFKTGPGDYAEHDQFIGVSVPNLRKIAKDYKWLTRPQIQQLIESQINEVRLLALLILVDQYNRAHELEKAEIYQFYLRNLRHVNNWNLVDASAHLIVGAHLLNADKTELLALANSSDLWERRVAIVSTWYFIRHDQFEWTMKLAAILLNDPHDLIHKAVGWMLREAGKRDQWVLINFLDKNSSRMPRTMLRYAIEKFSVEQRQAYLKNSKSKKY